MPTILLLAKSFKITKSCAVNLITVVLFTRLQTCKIIYWDKVYVYCTTQLICECDKQYKMSVVVETAGQNAWELMVTNCLY